MQLFTGYRDIKLNNLEKEKRWDWEKTQAKQFHFSVKSTIWEQLQESGSMIINNATSILISIMVAREVIEGRMSLGMMMSVQFILGQINGPLLSFLGLIHSYQDATISLERLSEVLTYKPKKNCSFSKECLFNQIEFKNVVFQHEGDSSPKILNNINFSISKNTKTAIVGESGSGKTTLIKLLLRIWEPTKGKIIVDSIRINDIDDYKWRENCGAVMQDSFLFSDTILNNVTLRNHDVIDLEKFFSALEAVNIKQWVDSLPNSYKTKIGDNGFGISEGQKQRLLIARAIYKNPKIIVFDEATNALDAINEKKVLGNLKEKLIDKIIVMVAHRLSSIKDADQIFVLENGHITELGNHESLLKRKGKYYQLLENQR